MPSCASEMCLRAETPPNTILPLMTPDNLQEEPFHTLSFVIVELLVTSTYPSVIKIRANGIVSTLSSMTIDRQVQPFIYRVILAILIES